MTLSVWYHGIKAGTLTGTARRGIVFQYDQSWLSRRDARPLSLSLPLGEREFSQEECLPYFGGLLPEGDAKRRISEYLHVSESSTIRLLELLGGECAGVVSLLVPGTEPGPGAGKTEYELAGNNYRPITEAEIFESLKRMPGRPLLLAQDGMRLSLAGAQEKIALAYFNGSWHVPLNGAPSTHILKPGYPGETDYPDIPVNEYICMRLAGKLGLPVPEAVLLDVQGIPVFCIARYDREPGSSSGDSYAGLSHRSNDETIAIRRIHQEDVCQALGIMSDRKYQADGGPSIAQIAALLRDYSSSPILDISLLMRTIVFQYLAGNCDAHGKNYSLLYGPSGSVALAPPYDIISTCVYPSLTRKMSMKVGKHYELDRIDKGDFADLLASLQLTPAFLELELKRIRSQYPESFSEISGLPELAPYGNLLRNIEEGFSARLTRLS